MLNRYYFKDDYVVIVSKNGEEIYIDKEDLKKVSLHTWCISKTGYAVSKISHKTTKMHRYILGVDEKSVVDHINRNRLDNRKSNLRICTQKDNSRNTSVSKNSRSGHLGIRITKSGKFRPRIFFNGREITGIPLFENLQDAINERKRLEKIYFGNYAPQHD